MAEPLSDLIFQSGWFNTDEAAEYLGTSTAYIRRLVKNGELPTHRLGRDLYHLRADLDTFKREHPRIGKRLPSFSLGRL